MKIGILADTHIPERADQLPPEIAKGLKGVEMIIHAGDITDLKVLEALKKICPDIRAVYGNMDPDNVRQRLPEKLLINAGRYKIGVMHGYGHPGKLTEMMGEAFKNDNVDLIIFGHSHAPLNERIGSTLFFNPGSATDKIFAPYNSYGIIEINDKIHARIVKI